MAKGLIIMHDLPVITTRRGSLPALRWPGISKIWSKSVRSVWPAKNTTANKIIYGPPSLKSDQLLLNIGQPNINAEINLIVEAANFNYLEQAIYQIITAFPYQRVKLYLIKDTPIKVNSYLVKNHLQLFISKEKKNDPELILQTINPAPGDVVVTPFFLPPTAGVKIVHWPFLERENKTTVFSGQRRAEQLPGAVIENFNNRLSLFTEELGVGFSEKVPTLVLERPANLAYDEKVSSLINQLTEDGHELLVLSVPSKSQASWWPLFAPHIYNVSPTHLNLAGGPVTEPEIIDYVRKYVYENNVPFFRAHSSAG